MKTENRGGMGLCSWLTVLFVGLKLTGYIAWPWVWVLAPLWGSFLIIVPLLLVIAILEAKLK